MGIKIERRMRLYGCPSCGSELSLREVHESKKETKGKYPCRFCTSREVEYLGLIDRAECYPEERD